MRDLTFFDEEKKVTKPLTNNEREVYALIYSYTVNTEYKHYNDSQEHAAERLRLSTKNISPIFTSLQKKNLIVKKPIPTDNPFKKLYSYQALLGEDNRPCENHKSDKCDKDCQLIKANNKLLTNGNNKVKQDKDTETVFNHLLFIYGKYSIPVLKELFSNETLNYLEKNKVEKWKIDKLMYIVANTVIDKQLPYLQSCLKNMNKSDYADSYSEDDDIVVI